MQIEFPREMVSASGLSNEHRTQNPTTAIDNQRK